MQRLPVTLGFCGFTVEDLCLIAISKCPIVLDKAVCSRLGIEVTDFGTTNANCISETSTSSNSVSRILSSLALERSIKSKAGDPLHIKSLLNQLNADDLEPIAPTAEGLDNISNSLTCADDCLGRSILISKLINTLSDYSDCVLGLLCEINGVKNIPFAELQSFPNSTSSSRNLQWLLQDSKYIQKSKGSDTSDNVKQLIVDLIVLIGNVRMDAERMSKSCKNFLGNRINTFKQQDLFEQIFKIQLNLHVTSIYNSIIFILQNFINLNNIISGTNNTYINPKLPSTSRFTTQMGDIELMAFNWIEALNFVMNDLICKASQMSKSSKKSGNGSAGQILGFGRGNLLVEQFFITKKQLLKDYNLCLMANELAELLVPQNQMGRKPKVPKGTQDFGPKQMTLRSMMFDKIKKIFLQHGAVEIDTPVFELRETLLNKYGDDQKLIFELKDQGGEQLALRYDLTIPFARFIASQQSNKIKRFHIGKVYRRDDPQMTNGRFREFVQCDFDISGDYDSMIPDAEVVFIMWRILQSFHHSIGEFKVKLSHRKLLDAVLEVSHVPQQLRKSISSSIDKLDKETWENISSEMMQKGLSQASIKSIKGYISLNGTISSVLSQLENTEISKLENAKTAIEEIKLFNQYTLSFHMGKEPPLVLDLSLARGLDYYTGLIYEAVLIDNKDVGSIAAGGRYDGLIGSFSSTTVPAIGLSIGVERLFRIIESKSTDYRTRDTKVYVCSIGDGMILERIKICSELWKADISAEFAHFQNPKIKKQLDLATAAKVPLVVIIGADELTDNSVIIKQKSVLGGNDWEQTRVTRPNMVQVLKQKIASFGYDNI
ncbi:histidyl-tRNA synthetase [Babesia microti strain RI]|uniref:histidine--tRNA ligase n=1 Tax=Babesia microti (strain RI) TaxID=1133968 RepID=I7IPT4_BABMR|nr:histidyl-tRNA synthetase [Babesia microti strain RI]CCF73205.1 histidyl-tRNA synthetase [Babesia microti strain RI]|eukprot:XP_012647814.1 histidyl-tRNA synthetase [Babesia microti strain RI]